MSADHSPHVTFRQRLRAREHLLGTFLKTPTTHATEILGGIGFDFVIVDQEHAPFDRVTIDMMVLAARAAKVACLVRVADPTPASILSVLDMGATGVLVPHVDSATRAKEIVAACRYRSGSRGFSNTTRAGGFGDASLLKHMADQDDMVTCVAMIEDLSALDRLGDIAAVPGVDAFFIGRGDLSAALAVGSQGSEQTLAAVKQITAAARTVNMPTMVLPSDRADAVTMHELGATAFVLSNDQSLLKRAARQALTEFAGPLS